MRWHRSVVTAGLSAALAAGCASTQPEARPSSPTEGPAPVSQEAVSQEAARQGPPAPGRWIAPGQTDGPAAWVGEYEGTGTLRVREEPGGPSGKVDVKIYARGDALHGVISLTRTGLPRIHGFIFEGTLTSPTQLTGDYLYNSGESITRYTVEVARQAGGLRGRAAAYNTQAGVPHTTLDFEAARLESVMPSWD